MKTSDAYQNFYTNYQTFKKYEVPTLNKKTIKQYDQEFWYPTASTSDMAVLEIGCGTGQFLHYLHYKGVTRIAGVDHDDALKNFIHPVVRPNFIVADIFEYLGGLSPEEHFDRIVLFDVLEHFDRNEGRKLFLQLAQILERKGQIVLRVPNMASPWGAQHQFGDLTHKEAYTPNSIRQLALGSGLKCLDCYPQKRGSNSRRNLEGLLHTLLSKVLVEPPEIWSANFLAILERSSD